VLYGQVAFAHLWVVRSAQKYWILYAGFNGFFAFRFSLFARAPSSYFVRLFVRCLGARKNYNYKNLTKIPRPN
jgi:hypothetical protein